MCHQTVRPIPTGQSPASGDVPAAQTQRDAGPEPPAHQEGARNQDSGSTRQMQSEAATPRPTEGRQKEETESVEGEDCEREDKDQPADTHGEAVHGLRFSSSGDFVGLNELAVEDQFD